MINDATYILESQRKNTKEEQKDYKKLISRKGIDKNTKTKTVTNQETGHRM